MIERSLVLVKPDGVSRGLMGEIISRIEKTGLKINGVKLARADDKLLNEHYLLHEEWARILMEKSKRTAEKEGRKFPYKDHMEFGKLIQSRLKSTLKEGQVLALIVEGPHAIEIIRKLVGHTEPKQALPGTIRGDLVFDSYQLADKENRAVRNLVHASSNKEDAEREIKLWFDGETINGQRK